MTNLLIFAGQMIVITCLSWIYLSGEHQFIRYCDWPDWFLDRFIILIDKRLAKFLPLCAFLLMPFNFNDNIFTIFGSAVSKKSIYSVCSPYQKAKEDAVTLIGLSGYQSAGQDAITLIGLSGYQSAGETARIGLGISGYQSAGQDAITLIGLSGYQSAGRDASVALGLSGYQSAERVAVTAIGLSGHQSAGETAGIGLGISGYQSAKENAESFIGLTIYQKVGEKTRTFGIFSKLSAD